MLPNLDPGRPESVAEALRSDGNSRLPPGFRIRSANPSIARANANQVYRFDLEYEGVTLAAPSDYVAIVSRNGRLLASRIRTLPDSVDGNQPTTVAADAVSVALIHARNALTQAGPLTATDPRLEIWVDGDGRGRLSWLTMVRESAGLGASTSYRIAAIGEPRVLSAVDMRQYQSTIRVQSNVWQLSPNLPPVVAPLSDATVFTDAGSGLSDQNGNAVFPTLAPGTTASAQLRGPFAVTTNRQGLRLLGTATIAGASTTLDFGAATEFELAQTTAFYSATFTSRWVRSYLPSLNGRVTNLDELRVATNENLACNAFAALGLIVFGRAASGCNNTATPSVVAHEFGHEVHVAFVQDAFDGSYSEGFGDALAALVTGQPCLGPGFFTSSETCLRDASDVTTFPAENPDVHEQGRPYAQFAWVLATTLGVDTAAQLVLGAAAAAPIDIPDAVRLSFVVDDDDGLLGTCSPNQHALEAAADSRLLPRPPDCRPAGDNSAPTALDDAVSLIEDAPATAMALTANDTDPDGDALVVTNIQQGSLGVVACTTLGCAYTPHANAHGIDTIGYSVGDTYGGSASAVVRVTITPVEDAVSISGPGDLFGGEDDAIPVTASVIDPDGPAFSLQWIARDGLLSAPCTFANPAAAATTMTCTRDGAFEVAMLVQQGLQQTVGPAGTAVIANTRPSVMIAAPVSGSSFPETQVVQLLSTFEDGPAAGAHTCEIAWGDGVVTTGVVDVGTCSSSHTYGAAGTGTRQIVVSIFDAALTPGSAAATITINSTAGTCVKDSGQACSIAGAGLVGNVRFKLAARQVGPMTMGQLELNEGTGWRFDTKVVAAFSMSGSAATFAGDGFLDGRPGYRFEASVQDNRALGLPDRLRVVVRDSTGAVVRVVDGTVSRGQVVVN